MKFIDWIVELFSKIFGKSNEGVQTGNTTTNTNTNTNTNTEKPNTVHADDKQDDVSVNNETETKTMEKKEGFVVLIDNGHGNDTKGKRSPYAACKAKPEIEYYEYKWNREIAGKLVEELQALGYDARLVVTELDDISLSERVRRANKVCTEVGAKNVLFISIHGNAAGNGSKWMTGRGWCAYTCNGQTKSDRFAGILYSFAEKNFKGMKIRKDMRDGDPDIEEDFTVIAKTKCPAVLTENFFYDNVDDVKYMLSEEGRAAIIKTHIEAIEEWYKEIKK